MESRPKTELMCVTHKHRKITTIFLPRKSQFNWVNWGKAQTSYGITTKLWICSIKPYYYCLSVFPQTQRSPHFFFHEVVIIIKRREKNEEKNREKKRILNIHNRSLLATAFLFRIAMWSLFLLLLQCDRSQDISAGFRCTRWHIS